MQKQQGFGPSESDHSKNDFTKYQVLISSHNDVFDRKPAVAKHQMTEPAVANQEVLLL